MKHSEALSFYRGRGLGELPGVGGLRAAGAQPRGVEVTILRIPRADAKVDAAAVDDFWVRHLDAQGARRVDVEPLGDL